MANLKMSSGNLPNSEAAMPTRKEGDPNKPNRGCVQEGEDNERLTGMRPCLGRVSVSLICT